MCKDISGCPLPLQRVNGGPERGGVVPQATQMMQDRVVAFRLPAVLPEKIPDGPEHASPSSLWAACCLSFKVGLSPLPSFLATQPVIPHCEPPLSEAYSSCWASSCFLCSVSFASFLSVSLWQLGLFLPLFRAQHRPGIASPNNPSQAGWGSPGRICHLLFSSVLSGSASSDPAQLCPLLQMSSSV